MQSIKFSEKPNQTKSRSKSERNCGAIALVKPAFTTNKNCRLISFCEDYPVMLDYDLC